MKCEVSPTIARRFVDLATGDASVIVRRQLASTAKRLPPADCLPIVAALARHDEDADDPYLPLLVWWALEHCRGAGSRTSACWLDDCGRLAEPPRARVPVAAIGATLRRRS